MKKLVLIAALLCAFVVLGWAGGGSSSSASTAARRSQMEGRVKGSLPLSDGSVTLSVFIGGLGSMVTSFDYADNDATKKIMDETGIKLDIIASSATDANTRRNVLLSSGDYPDLFIGNYIGRDFMTYYASQGIFLPLDDYNPTSYPNIKALWDEYPSVYTIIRWNGKIYALPGINDCEHCVDDTARIFSYMPWLRAYGRPVTNLAQFTDYLRYVRDNDLNGNGNRNDEVPFMFQATGQRRAISVFAKMFMPFVMGDAGFGLAMENGRIVEQYKDPRFRDALRAMASLYNERLILPESFTMDRERVLSLVEAQDPTVAMMVGQHISGMTYGTGERRIDFNLMPVLAGPTGIRTGANGQPWWPVNLGMFITDKCPDPELAVAFYDYLLRMDVMLATYFGLKGDAWTDPDPGAVGINGKPALYKYNITWMGPDHRVNMGWAQNGTFGQTVNFRLGEQAMGFDTVRRWMETGDPSLRAQILANPSYFETHNYLSLEGRRELWLPASVFVPPLNMDTNDTARMQDITTPFNNFMDQAHAQFIIGERDINNDAHWNTYIQELDRMGAADRVNLMQRYIGR